MTADDELLQLLDNATGIVAAYEAMNPHCGYDTGVEFAVELRTLRERVARHDRSVIGPLIAIFGPTGSWDEGVGPSGADLANRVMAVLDEIK
jgi:hypothetical protein